jgi:Family of unknown function (DUF6496)
LPGHFLADTWTAWISNEEDNEMPKYGKKAQKTVEETMHEFKEGKLKSGSGKKVTNPKQAIAIGLSEARKKGAKVPKKKEEQKN